MSTFKITKSRKQAGAYEHLRIVGVCIDGKYYDKAAIYDSIVGGNTFLVHRPPAPDVEVERKLENGIKYIQTKPDKFKLNNLLNLDDC